MTTTDTEYDTFQRGIGITTLASDRGTVDPIRENSPIATHGGDVQADLPTLGASETPALGVTTEGTRVDP